MTKPKLRIARNKDVLQWKTTKKVKSGISQRPQTGSSSNFKLNQNLLLVVIQTTSNTKRPPNIKSGISQLPLIRSFSNVKLKLKGRYQADLQLKTTSKCLKSNYSAATDWNLKF